MSELGPLLERVRFAVFDFDGVFTDNRVWVNERGEEMLAFTRSDGLGLRRLDEVGVRCLIVSMEPNPIVGARAEKLEVDCVQGVDDKLAVLRERGDGRAARGGRVSSGTTSTTRTASAPSDSPSSPPTPGPRCAARAVGALASRRRGLRARVLRRRLGGAAGVTTTFLARRPRRGGHGRRRPARPRDRARPRGARRARGRVRRRADRFNVDVTDRAAIEAATDEVAAEWGAPHVLVNAAALDSPPDAPPEEVGPFESYPESRSTRSWT